MFFKIFFAICMAVIGTGLANRFCKDLKNIKDKDKFPFEHPKTKVEHCFFTLSDKDEKDYMIIVDATYKRYNKAKVAEYCKSYKANLPQLKDGEIAKFFETKVCKGCFTLLGLTIKSKVDKPESVTFQWDTDTTTTTITENVYNSSTQLLEVDCPNTLLSLMHISNNGHWKCWDTLEKTYNTTVFCHHETFATTTKATVKPTIPQNGASTKGSGSSGKAIALAATALIIRQMFPARMNE